MKYKHLFGPVPSRRLGISLGVDLVPYKVCTLNCIYCESGATTNLTLERKEYISAQEIIIELKDFLKDKPDLDFITFSGAGEPLLNSGIGKIIEFLKKNYSQYKLALITNSTLLHIPQIRKELLLLDLILPSLDAFSENIFKKINRPANTLNSSDLIDGLIQFRKEFQGEIWLEIFLVPDLNDDMEELQLLKKAIFKIKPDRIQLNTLDRPGTVNSIKPLSIEKLEKVKEFFQPLPVEIISKFYSRKKISSFNEDVNQLIVETIKRRPCTDDDLVEITGLHRNELNKYISELLNSKKIKIEKRERGNFFCLDNQEMPEK